MPIFRKNQSGEFVPFEKTPFPDIEQVLEDWIEANPQLLTEDDDIAIIARQQRTSYGKIVDLLGVDESGACVVVELKRGETPRDVVAQALEYAAWVDSLTMDELDDIARKYTSARGRNVEDLADLYKNAFTPGIEDEADVGPTLLSQFSINDRQRLIILAEDFSPEVEQTIRYLRTKMAIDISGVRFSVHKTDTETIVETNVVVGREPVEASRSKTLGTTESESDDSILSRVTTDFMRRAVNDIEDWIRESDYPQLTVRHGPGSNHMVKLQRNRLIFYYYASEWLYVLLSSPTQSEIEILRSGLSKTNEIQERRNGDVRFHVVCNADLDVLKGIIQIRLRTAV